MSEYNQYVTAINKIFEIVSSMKTNIKNQDNISYIESIEEYKNIVIENAKIFDNTIKPQNSNMEELGND